MSLTPGSTLSSYEILDRLGAGAMGEVYRARDSRLHREVAVKVLPEHLAESPERLARFEREARSLASLNHPGIAQIYGVDHQAGTHFLVLELVPGETLEDRLARGPLPVDEAIELCRQIAEGLEAAHETGVIHRDLKPANVRITPDGKAKLLDFGLAKPSLGRSGISGSSGDGETLSMGAAGTTAAGAAGVETADGQLLGTPSYMAPEQARGRPVDRRADIWAFGCLLYECLAGVRPFTGESVPDVLSAVLSREPDGNRLPDATPAPVRRLIARCLTKDPFERLRDVGDARLELSRAFDPVSHAVEGTVSPADPRRSIPPWTLIGAFLAGAALLGISWLVFGSPEPPAREITRFSITGTGMPIDAFQVLALSPDGRRLVFRARGDDGVERLYVRSLDDYEIEPLPGTERSWAPFFSPDGEHVGAFGPTGILTVGFDGVPAREVVARTDRSFGGAWLPDGTIVFDLAAGTRLARMPASGGDVEILHFTIDGEPAEGILTSPAPLPDADAVLVQLRNRVEANSFDVAIADLAERSLQVIAENGFSPTWLPTGHVVYQQGQNGPLLALPFDLERRVATGPPFEVLSDIGTRVSIQIRMFTVADNGTLAYIPRSGLLDRGALVWVDRRGVTEPIVEIGRVVDSPRLAHDGRRVAFRTPAPNCDVWVYDLDRGVTARVTKEGDNHGLAWSPDDLRIATSRNQAGSWRPLAVRVDGSSEPKSIGQPVPVSWTTSYSPDGERLLVDGQTESSGTDIYVVDLGSGVSEPLIASPSEEFAGAFSPGGDRIAYVSNESGANEVYVQAYPGLDARVQISTGGGSEPVWSRDGRSLFFRNDRRVLAVDFDPAAPMSPSRPRLLFEGDFVPARPVGPPGFDVSADGERFVMVLERSDPEGAEINVVLNWLDEVRALDPSGR